MKIKSYNPANNELLGEAEQTDVNQIKEIVIKSKKAFESWGFLTIVERISYIKKLYEAFKSKKSGIGRNNSEFGLKELCNIKVVTYEK